MPTIHPSPVSPIDLDECFFLRGYAVDPVEHGYIPGDVPDLPLYEQTPRDWMYWDDPCDVQPATWRDVAVLGVAAVCGVVLWTACIVGLVQIARLAIR